MPAYLSHKNGSLSRPPSFGADVRLLIGLQFIVQRLSKEPKTSANQQFSYPILASAKPSFRASSAEPPNFHFPHSQGPESLLSVLLVIATMAGVSSFVVTSLCNSDLEPFRYRAPFTSKSMNIYDGDQRLTLSKRHISSKHSFSRCSIWWCFRLRNVRSLKIQQTYDKAKRH